MTVIKRNALVSYSVRQMFELVNNIEDYPRFLPWCQASHVISSSDETIEATLMITWAGVRKEFTTCNHLHPYERIEITLVSGPFRHLEGRWVFVTVNDKACKIFLELEFELVGSLMDRVFQPIFSHVANSLVELFCKRAAEIYGPICV